MSVMLLLLLLPQCGGGRRRRSGAARQDGPQNGRTGWSSTHFEGYNYDYYLMATFLSRWQKRMLLNSFDAPIQKQAGILFR